MAWQIPARELEDDTFSPWLMVGGALALGWVLHWWYKPRQRREPLRAVPDPVSQSMSKPKKVRKTVEMTPQTIRETLTAFADSLSFSQKLSLKSTLTDAQLETLQSVPDTSDDDLRSKLDSVFGELTATQKTALAEALSADQKKMLGVIGYTL